MAIFGHAPFETGAMTVAGTMLRPTDPRQAIRAGIGLLPGDRKGEGLALMQSVRDNGMLTARGLGALLAGDRRTAFVDLAGMDRLLDRMEVRAPSYDQEIRLLSGATSRRRSSRAGWR